MKIAVLLTFDQSLLKWKKSGHFDREIFYYKNLYVKKKIKTTFISFGFNSDKKLISKYKYLDVIPIYEKIRESKFLFIRFIKSLFIYFFIKKELDEINIIKSNQLWGTWILLLIKFLSQKKIIVRCGYEPNQNLQYEKGKIFLKFFSYIYSYLVYNISDCIIVTTLDIKKFIKKKFKTKKKIYIIPNFIDISKFKPKNFTRYKNKVLYVGRNSKEKNIKFLFESLKNLPIKLDILGSNFKKKDLSNFQKKYNIQISYKENISNNKMPDIYNKYKIYVSTSDYEGNPKTVLEAMACGCLVLARKVQGCKSIIKHNQNGFLVKNELHLKNLINQNISKINYEIKKNAIYSIKSKNDLTVITNKDFKILKIIKNEKINNYAISKKMWINSYF